MSTKYLFAALALDKGTISERSMKDVLIHLGDVADDDGMAFPTIEWLAKRCMISRRTVQRAIEDLTRDKFLRVEVRRNNAGNKKNFYFLSYNAIKPCDTMTHGTPETPENTTANSGPCDTMTHGEPEALDNPDNSQKPSDTVTSGHERQSHVTSTTIPCDTMTHNTLIDPLKDTKGDEFNFEWFLKTHPKAPKDVEKCRGLFNKLTSEHLLKVRDHLLWYKDSQANIRFLKGPESYLWQREYMNPIPAPVQTNGHESKQVVETKKYLAEMEASEESKASPEFVASLLNEHGIKLNG